MLADGPLDCAEDRRPPKRRAVLILFLLRLGGIESGDDEGKIEKLEAELFTRSVEFGEKVSDIRTDGLKIKSKLDVKSEKQIKIKINTRQHAIASVNKH